MKILILTPIVTLTLILIVAIMNKRVNSETNITWMKNIFVIKMLLNSLANFPDLSRKRVDDILATVEKLFDRKLQSMQKDLENRLKNFEWNNLHFAEIKAIFEEHYGSFENLKTEHKRIKFYTKLKFYIALEHYLIGERPEFRIKNGTTVQEHVPVTAQIIPERRVSQQLFELPGVFDETLSYFEKLKSFDCIVSNIIQSSFWKTKIANNEEKTVLPSTLFFHDYENNNCIASHKGVSKCGAVYLSLPCLPPHMVSKLENIILFALFNTLDRAIYKNNVVFSKVIEELLYLQKVGISITHQGSGKQIFFKLCLIIGDNLGLNSIFGFQESFSAHKFCRFCLTGNNEKHNIFYDEQYELRTIESYEKYVQDKKPKETGIKESSPFNKLKDFHVIDNLSVDVMHDLLEGICRYDLALILHNFIYEKKYLTYKTFCNRVRGFYYGNKYGLNKVPEISEHNIKSKYIILSSAEMLLLVNNINLMIGDVIPEDDEV